MRSIFVNILVTLEYSSLTMLGFCTIRNSQKKVDLAADLGANTSANTNIDASMMYSRETVCEILQ